MRLIKEPLVHFALAGAALFAAHAWLNRGEMSSDRSERTLRIGEREVAWLAETWSRQQQRPPTDAELQGLLADYLKEELLAREARALELDRDDTVVRRRLAQKMGFVLEDTARIAEPTEGELRALYDTRRAEFATPARTSFEQIFFDVESRGERAAADARDLLARLEREAGAVNFADQGDRTLLPPALEHADESEIAEQFGAELAGALIALEPGGWRGPIVSTFGLHLVRVTERQAPRARPFEEVRDALAAEWLRGREEAARRAYFAALLEKYDVEVAESARPLLAPALAALRGEAE